MCTRRRPKSKCAALLAVAAVVVAACAVLAAIAEQRRRLALPLTHSSLCRFPAVFNFGDSNSDTGADSAVFGAVASPNGVTFFGKPSGRYSDGRLIIDFLTEELGLRSLRAYVDSVGADFRHGANFAVSGATIRALNGEAFEKGFNPISLQIQLLQFKQFKERAIELHRDEQQVQSLVPRPGEFREALYMMDAGQNDLHVAFSSMAIEQLVASIPDIIHQFVHVVEQLYHLGARTFWIHNTGPIGCLPYSFLTDPPKPEDLDLNGCIQSYNEVAKEFSMQLKQRVFQLIPQLNDAVFTYVDIYSAKYSLISDADKYGFVDPFGYCCGHFGDDYNVDCGKSVTVNGVDAFGVACSNPSQYISWDSAHYSEAANQLVADQILNGSLSDPPLTISEACHAFHPS